MVHIVFSHVDVLMVQHVTLWMAAAHALQAGK